MKELRKIREHESVYDQSIGYSSLNMVDSEKKFTEVENCKKVIVNRLQEDLSGRVLVAGAGNGEEARVVSLVFKLPTIGVDVDRKLNYHSSDRSNLCLCRQDITALGFADESISTIYSYHVLEHVNDPISALNEFNRLLKSNGALFIGFPNKHRLFSYFGTSQKATIIEKVIWNLHDYKDRLQKKFDNKYGAHAGFTEKEFLDMSKKMFKNTISVRNDYMLIKYKKYQWIIKIIIGSGLADFLFPSNYFICTR
jgi:2-polyprenyl-3-methyl-5-hydroxy-6-metoxy-1,4-benzoquinol methylase